MVQSGPFRTKCLDHVRLGFDALTNSDLQLIESRRLSNYVNQENLDLDDAMLYSLRLKMMK